MLEVKNLHANVNGKEILKGINLSVKAGEVHAIMGPNGSGKSTLSSVLVGNPAFEVTEGEVIFNGKNLLDLSPEDRSREGIFLSFQYPVEIPGVSMVNFMRAALNEHRKYNGLEPVSATDFLKLMREKRAIVELDNKLASRSVNEGFSGGEKKRNEIFQMAMLEPKLAILDETDSGLDIDALRIVAHGVNQLRTPENAAIVITHYQRLLDYIKPDVVHVLYKGRIVKTAGPELALELEEKGYEVINIGTDTHDSCNYPEYGEKAGRMVAAGEVDGGVLICGTGVGISIAANKVKGVRAAVCSEPVTARLVKEHNNANIIAFGARIVGSETAKAIVDAWLNAEFQGGRHQTRIDMIHKIEE
jgi:Fe-S cluster assembly ATP-binding protein